MRAALLALVLANILYWTWASQVDGSARTIEAALDPDLPTLELIARAPVLEDQANPAATDELTDEPAVEITRVGADGVLSVDDTPAEVEVVAQNIQGAESAPVARVQSRLPEQKAADAEAVAAPISAAAQNLLAAVDVSAFPNRCVGVGPFATLKQASDAAALVTQAGQSPSQRAEEAQVWVGHWVHLPSYPSRADAVKVVETLREKGVKDIYIEPSGELKNTISLGLFTELARAEVRAGQVRKLAEVSPQIRNRSRDGLVYWIDVPLDAGVTLNLDALPRKDGQEIRMEPVECPPIAANG